MEVKFKLTSEDYNSITWSIYKKSKKSKIIKTAVYGYLIIALLLIIKLCLSDNNIKDAVMYTMVIFMMACVFKFFTTEKMQQKRTIMKNTRQLKKEKNSKYLAEQKVIVEDGKIRHIILNEIFDMEIDEEVNIVVKDRYIYIYTDNYKEFKNRILLYCNVLVTPCIVIPIAAFNSSDEKEEFIKKITLQK
mgnify:CR=1 FL=1